MTKNFSLLIRFLTLIASLTLMTQTAFGDSITFYEDEYYRGRSFRVDNAGEISNLRDKDLGANDNFNDEISSISIDGNFKLTLFEDNDFRGRSVSINLSRPFLDVLSSISWDDRVSSIKWEPLGNVEEQVVVIFYDQANFRGNSFIIRGSGDVYKLNDKKRGSSRRNWNDQIRSVKISGLNTLVELYAHSKYRGRLVSLTQSQSSLTGYSFVAAASSVKVFD